MRISQTKEYLEYLKSEKWLIFSTDAKVATGGRCQGCDRETWNLHVHHLTYVRLGNERPSDIWVVCPSCHLRFHPQHKSVVNKARKKAGRRRIKGWLGHRPHPVKRTRHPKKAKPNRPAPWSAEDKARIEEQVLQKLGAPRPMAKDFRKHYLGS